MDLFFYSEGNFNFPNFGHIHISTEMKSPVNEQAGILPFTTTQNYALLHNLTLWFSGSHMATIPEIYQKREFLNYKKSYMKFVKLCDIVLSLLVEK